MHKLFEGCSRPLPVLGYTKGNNLSTSLIWKRVTGFYHISSLLQTLSSKLKLNWDLLKVIYQNLTYAPDVNYISVESRKGILDSYQSTPGDCIFLYKTRPNLRILMVSIFLFSAVEDKRNIMECIDCNQR